MAFFLPRPTFPPLLDVPRSYFLGHHKSGLEKMKTLLSSIDLVVEVRDYRVPLTSRNPLFEKSLEGKERLVVYTKRDLGGGPRDTRNEDCVKKWHKPVPVLFVRNGFAELAGRDRGRNGGAGAGAPPPPSAVGGRGVARLLEFLREFAQKRWKLVGHRVLVVGMPNVGKSTLLNALRAQGVGKGKVAKTGAQPGVTRKIGSGVKIIPSEDDVETMDVRERKRYEGIGGGVYLVDTPGVFIPHVPDAEAMMKLALCGSVKDTIIPPVILADYLLYHINKRDPSLYAEYCPPTNEIMELLEAIAKKTGRLAKGGKADIEATSLWMIQRWRTGFLGKFLLDDVHEGALDEQKLAEEELAPSFNQARRAERERRRARNIARGEK